uniref:uncharacterized protein LOC117611034 n=1 Tax=Osmia lignaria TaxID=473952 RepID=UPI001478BBD8|nr:uncharacterized protein LOC117611034 [Osmia lignaria]
MRTRRNPRRVDLYSHPAGTPKVGHKLSMENVLRHFSSMTDHGCESDTQSNNSLNIDSIPTHTPSTAPTTWKLKTQLPLQHTIVSPCSLPSITRTCPPRLATPAIQTKTNRHASRRKPRHETVCNNLSAPFLV